jgi:2,3-bisphosphoglycerate-dependent phosphoglycerate mutase
VGRESPKDPKGFGKPLGSGSVFYLVRHAHAGWTPDENRPLSAQGRADAGQVADVLVGFPITAIYSSPARRAWETVAPLAARLGLPVHAVPDLRERKLCAGAVDDFFAAVRATWADPSFAHPGGESNAAAQRRGVAVIQGLMERHPTGHVVLGTHGNLLALVLQHFDAGVDFAFWRSLTMPDVYECQVGVDGDALVRRLWEC